MEGTDTAGLATGEAAKLVTALETRPGHVVVTGPDAQAAEAFFAATVARAHPYRAVSVDGRALDPTAAVATLLGAADAPPQSAVAARAALQALVGEAQRAERPIVVAVRDADATEPARLEALRRALEACPEAPGVVRVVLLGGPELVETLRQPDARSFATRVVAVIRLPAEAPAEPAPVPVPARHAFPYAQAAAVAGVAAVAVWVLAMLPERRAPVVDDQPAVALAPATVPAPAEPGPVAPPSTAATPTTEPPTPAAAPTTPPSTAPAVASAAEPAVDAAREAARPSGAALQVGAFVQADNAERLRRRLAEDFPGVYVVPVERNGTTYHRVRVGGFASDADRQAAATALAAAGFAPILARD